MPSLTEDFAQKVGFSSDAIFRIQKWFRKQLTSSNRAVQVSAAELAVPWGSCPPPHTPRPASPPAHCWHCAPLNAFPASISYFFQSSFHHPPGQGRDAAAMLCSVTTSRQREAVLLRPSAAPAPLQSAALPLGASSQGNSSHEVPSTEDTCSFWSARMQTELLCVINQHRRCARCFWLPLLTYF